jgi:hypothetical protein
VRSGRVEKERRSERSQSARQARPGQAAGRRGAPARGALAALPECRVRTAPPAGVGAPLLLLLLLAACCRLASTEPAAASLRSSSPSSARCISTRHKLCLLCSSQIAHSAARRACLGLHKHTSHLLAAPSSSSPCDTPERRGPRAPPAVRCTP